MTGRPSRILGFGVSRGSRQRQQQTELRIHEQIHGRSQTCYDQPFQEQSSVVDERGTQKKESRSIFFLFCSVESSRWPSFHQGPFSLISGRGRANKNRGPPTSE